MRKLIEIKNPLVISAVFIIFFNAVEAKNLKKKKIHHPHEEHIEDPATFDISLRESFKGISVSLSRKYNVCDHQAFEMPDFEEEGLTLSEVKCFEHMWHIREAEEQKKRKDACDYSKFGHSVFGGRNAKRGEFAHMAAVGWKSSDGTWIFKCGGSLISTTFLLTVAHCSKRPHSDTSVADTVPVIVRLGDENIMDPPEYSRYSNDYRIKRIISHKKYVSPSKYYDIALIELEVEVEFSWLIHPACIWSHHTVYERANMTGWGVIESGSKIRMYPDLQVGSVNTLRSSECRKMLKSKHNRNWRSLADHQLCAGHLDGGIDTCQGDSGGPLQVKINFTSHWSMHFVIGVTSFGFGCGRAYTPSVYTRVSTFTPWIEGIVWKKDREIKPTNHERLFVA